MSSRVAVCDIGGTTLRVALADRAGNLYARRAAPHTTLEPAAVLDTLAREITTLAEEQGTTLLGVGASVPGPLDGERGIIHFSPNLKWRDIAFVDELSARLGLPVALDDDANCAALGEHWRSGRDVRHFVYIIVGTGIGGGLVLDGKIYRGARGGAGEIGHMTIERNGPLCSCGNYGCLEALAAGPALVRRARESGGAYASAREAIAAARAGDERAGRVMAAVGTDLGIGLGNVVNLLNPERIVVGGGVALDAGELLLAPAREEMNRRAFASSAADVTVELAQLGDDAGLIGAARLIWEKIDERRG